MSLGMCAETVYLITNGESVSTRLYISGMYCTVAYSPSLLSSPGAVSGQDRCVPPSRVALPPADLWKEVEGQWSCLPLLIKVRGGVYGRSREKGRGIEEEEKGGH